MFKSQKLTFLFGTLLLVVSLVGISFAWYLAIANNFTAINLGSEGISVTLNEKSGMLEPDILAEGVYNGSLPDPMLESYYVSRGNTVYVREVVKLFVADNTSSELTFNIKLSYQTEVIEDGKVVSKVVELDLNEDTYKEYFNISMYLSDEEVAFNELSDSDLIELNELTKANLEGTHHLVLAISYAKPDELLPIDLINSPAITLNITAALN